MIGAALMLGTEMREEWLFSTTLESYRFDDHADHYLENQQ